MIFLDKETVERVRKEYPTGTRIRLLHMEDPYRQMKQGMTGTVTGVDDTATIHAIWDEGGSLGVVYGEDSCEKIPLEKE